MPDMGPSQNLDFDNLKLFLIVVACVAIGRWVWKKFIWV